LAPLLLRLSDELFPVTFDLVAVHLQPFRSLALFYQQRHEAEGSPSTRTAPREGRASLPERKITSIPAGF
jgi:hypothetical protein